MSLTGKNYIGGDIFATSNEAFLASDPLTGDHLEPFFYQATQAEIEVAFYKAKMAFRKYSRQSQQQRATLLRKIREKLLQLEPEVIARCCLETGLSKELVQNEQARTALILASFAEQLEEGSWVKASINTRPAAQSDIRSMQRAIGVVLVFGASNFPLGFSVIGPDVIAALASGCAVVVKAYPSHAGTSEYITRAVIAALQECEMPEGLFSLLQGESVEVDMMLASHPMVKAIAIAGALQGNNWILSTARSRKEGVPVYAETGSLNPVILFPGKLAENPVALATELAQAVLRGAGQYCTKPGMVVMPKGADSNRLKGKLAEIFTDSRRQVMFSENLVLAFHEGVYALSREKGVKLLASGKADGDGFYGLPHLFECNTLTFFAKNQRLVDIFGPVLMLVEVEDMDDMVEFMNTLNGHLAVSVYASNEELDEYRGLLRELLNKAGRVIINDLPGQVEIASAMVQGGPVPATTDSRVSIIGNQAILRFARPVCYQDFPEQLLPDELRDSNPLGIEREVNGNFSRDPVR